MKYLNLGCGSRYVVDKEWKNVDFVSNDNNVMAYNLVNGIPFADNSFDLVYHSHVLEHFSKKDGKKFIEECFRVLMPGGTVRVAVPDLERIAREYLRNLELALLGDRDAEHNYEWIKLEMYDQTVRNQSGGEMAKYLFQNEIPNEQYVFERIGEEGRDLRKMYLQGLSDLTRDNNNQRKASIRGTVRSFVNKSKHGLKKLVLKKQLSELDILKNEASIGKFRLGGEIHQWMYDRYSLSKLLRETGFRNIEVKDAFTSEIHGWNDYELESKNGTVFKPDSLFMEAIK